MREYAKLCVLLLFLGHAFAGDLEHATFGGRKLKQNTIEDIRARFGGGGQTGNTGTPSSPNQAGSTGSNRPTNFPAPEGGSADDWEIISKAPVQGAVNRVFNRIRDPRDALVFAFGDLIFTTTRPRRRITRLVLNSGNEIEVENTRTGISRPGLFHLFKIVKLSPGVLVSGDTNIDITGSQFFIQVSGVSEATVDIGWLMVVNPAEEQALITSLFQGIAEELAARFKSVFQGADCDDDIGVGSLYRDISGVCNNIRNPFGITGHKLFRIGEPDFGDGLSSLGGSTINPRRISNIVCREDSSSDDGANRMGITDMMVFHSQFIDHDIGISPIGSFARSSQPLFSISFEEFLDEIPIEIPEDDPDFTDKRELPFERAVFVRENNREVTPREIVNEITSFLDLSQVYGSSASRARALRTFSGGKLKTSGANMLPFNGDGDGGVGISLENAPDPTNRFPVAGDIRVAENVNLQALHTVWLREHNKIAEELASAFETDEEIYQTARAIAIAEYQSILYTEWLPLILGSDSPSPSAFSYNRNIDASADAFFTTASFRFGHSMISSKLWRVNPGETTPFETANLREGFFTPEAVTSDSIDSWIRGMAWHQAREAEEKIVDDLRSFLFTQDGAPSQDLISLNILRARDMGVPTYNKARGAFGLDRKSSISDISDNAETVANIEEAYNGSVDDVDSFVGGLAETKPEGRLFGDLFHESIKEQFTRLRDGDRYFYKDLDFELIQTEYPRALDIQQDKVKYIDVLERNTGVTRDNLNGRASPLQL